ncbi:putative ubiquitin hydrolase, putative,cysteine peptidase, Clan CA, family C19 [Trypanosoma grayi]|uniref:putative ubiquitin hydrolase, putative,cysteine peptidase, Clan CA, family C19 n=1 Tax=Trypanosoma grayi TaxID=71804 RepID=UPI0004F48B9A|nr:putative ubiquitin hydrolase, putative,cysteine peptidase, Clan CA, family C19 [Trypanosoma grayi]KEG07277.1 putative ubiquitin hydrolase, putative,cysteine peptidase, Clan CA, family C19 [Trypanosoma grayi]
MNVPAIQNGTFPGPVRQRRGRLGLQPSDATRQYANSATPHTVTELPRYPGTHRSYSRHSPEEVSHLSIGTMRPPSCHSYDAQQYSAFRSRSCHLSVRFSQPTQPQLVPLQLQQQQPQEQLVPLQLQLQQQPEQQKSKMQQQLVTSQSLVSTVMPSVVVPRAPSSASSQCAPIPLRNFGNTCYLNAIIQCVVHSPGLLSRLEQSIGMAKRQRATSALLDLGATNVTNPGQLLLAVKNEAARRNDEFSDNTQSDAHEFLHTFLFAVHSEINRGEGDNAAYEELKDMENESEEAAMQRWCEHHLRVDDSAIYEVFGGVLQSKCVCSSCGRRSLTFDPFLDLSLPMPTSKKSASIESILKDNFEDACETLRGGNQLLCMQCKRLRNGSRIVRVMVWPSILVLHLKRFDDTGRKNGAPVVYPEAFMTCGDNPTRYRLYGVVCHHGTENWGHYMNYICVASDRWYLCNDATITPASAAEAVQALAHAYILFYAMVK